MASINEKLNSCDVKSGIELALSHINLTEGSDNDESITNAICWLGYRCLEGSYPIEEFNKIKDTPFEVKTEGLSARWKMSIGILSLYCLIKSNEDKVSELKEEDFVKAFEIWKNENLSVLWIPQILNYLRSSVLYAYYLYLTGNNNDCQKVCLEGIEQWKNSVNNISLKENPLRFTEMRDDIISLQFLVFLLKESGFLNFDYINWCNPNELNQIFKKEPYFNKALRVLGKINKERSIWNINQQ
jgi:hypothetical protein